MIRIFSNPVYLHGKYIWFNTPQLYYGSINIYFLYKLKNVIKGKLKMLTLY